MYKMVSWQRIYPGFNNAGTIKTNRFMNILKYTLFMGLQYDQRFFE